MNATKWSGRVVLFAGSHVGVRVAEFLASINADATVAIPPHSEFAAILAKSGMPTVSADYHDFDILDALDLGRASSIILPLDDESLNIRLALRAVEINPHIRVVIRLFNLNLGRRLKDAVASFTVLSVSKCAAPTFAAAAVIEDLLLSHRVGESSNLVCFYRVTADESMSGTVAGLERTAGVTVVALDNVQFPAGDSALKAGNSLVLFSDLMTGRKLQKIKAPAAASSVHRQTRTSRTNSPAALDPILARILATLAIIAGGSVAYFSIAEKMRIIDALYFVITVMTTVGFGDINLKDASDLSKIVGMLLMLSGVALFAILFAFVSDALMKKRIEYLLGRHRIKISDHVILCGLGDVGGRILDVLVEMGEKIVVIERNPENRFLSIAREKGIPYIIADASLGDVLDDAGVDSARAIICATDDDLKNVEIGMDVKAHNDAAKVAVRIFDKEFAEKVENCLPLDAVLSASAITAPLFAAAALGAGVIGRLDCAGGRLFFKQTGRQELAANSSWAAGEGRVKFLFALLDNGALCFCEAGLPGSGAANIFYLGETP